MRKAVGIELADGAEVGAGRSWNDPEFGNGAFTIMESVAGERVRYRVEVEDG